MGEYVHDITDDIDRKLLANTIRGIDWVACSSSRFSSFCEPSEHFNIQSPENF